MTRSATATLPAPNDVSQDPRNYVPPPVEAGQVVLWSYGQGERPTPALVISVATKTLNLSIHMDSIKDHVLKNGVRHINDPILRTQPAHDQGVWDLTPRDKRLNALLESLGASATED